MIGSIRCLRCGESYAEFPPGCECTVCSGPVSQHAGYISAGPPTDIAPGHHWEKTSMGHTLVRDECIWKFTLPVADDIVSVQMPAGARALFVAEQYGAPCVWAKVNPDAPLVEQRFRWAGTAHPLGNVGRYIGSWISAGGALVWHLFEDGTR